MINRFYTKQWFVCHYHVMKSEFFIKLDACMMGFKLYDRLMTKLLKVEKWNKPDDKIVCFPSKTSSIEKDDQVLKTAG